jgi:hypothetical protein
LEQVVATVEQCLEGPVTEKVIQEFIEQEALAKQQVEVARAKIEAFEAVLCWPSTKFWEPWSCLTIFGTSTGWSKTERPGEAEIVGSRPFCGIFGF